MARLRGFADRKLATYLLDLYVLAATNSAKPVSTAKAGTTSMEVVRALARRALAGQLGAEALLLDTNGRERVDESTLRVFARAYRELKRG